MKSNRPNLVALVSCLLAIAALLLTSTTNAQDLVAPYRDFKPPEDMATRLMEGLLGASFTSPLTAGLTTNTLFGAIFLVFNIIVFAVGSVFASYGVIAGIVQTAHEGVVLGKRMSAVWMPVRMVTGIGGLIPAFGGFSLSQIIMIIAASWGISFGNYAYDAAIKLAAAGSTLVSAGFSRVDPNKDANAMAQALFRQRLCELAYFDKRTTFATYDPPLQISPTDQIKEIPFNQIERSGTVLGRAIGTELAPTKCYAVGMKRKTYLGGLVNQEGRWSDSAVGFRSGAVDYEAINKQAWGGYAANFPEFVSRIHSLADRYMSERRTSTKSVPYPNEDIRAAGVWFGGATKIADVNDQAIKKDALANMSKHGWFSAGSFYSTHAEVNAAVIQAADATEFLIVGPSERPGALTSGDFEVVYAESFNETGSTGLGQSRPGSFCIVDQNATGNCSLGQKLVSLMLNAGTAGAGGSATVVDPIIAMKNIGDYMMVLGETILAATWFSGTIGAAASAVSTAAPVVTAVAPAAGLGMAFTADLVKAIGGMAPYIGGLLFAVGALCAIYIPMVPFINWVSGLVQYCCIVVESLAAAPLWAFAHLQAEGEGMGQRTERGYLYILNLLFRPILMVAAFFAASALVIILGSLIMQMYAPAMAAAQGNSITGLFSAIGYVFLFFVIMNTVIQGLFHLVMELPDDAIGWVGGIGRSNIGRDTEGKVHQVFMAGGRFGSGSAGQAGAAVKKMSEGGTGGSKGAGTGSKE
jgi:conjugal transfer/type IV secretion protein DotA/TraY